MAALASLRSPLGVRALPAARASRPSVARVVCQAHKEEQDHAAKLVAAVVAGCLLTGAMVPEEALAAKSSGRVGGASGFRKSAAPSRSMETRSTTVVNNTTVVAAPVMAPPLVGGYGYGGGFGFGGFHFMPTFFVPIPFFGGLFQLFVVLALFSVVFGVIRNLIGSGNDNKKKDSDGWGDL